MKKNYAYVDGSFRPDTGFYGAGVLLVDQNGNARKYMSMGDDPSLAKMRNVAGEIMAAAMAIALAKGFGMRRLTIFYDYEGIENWVTGKWKANKPYTIHYMNFVKSAIRSGLKIYFRHVKGHSGNLENEEADRLAKIAVGIIKE